MRITNKMMNNTSLTNINKNKTYLDKLNNQLASEKKITRPSDDPIIAIRALKLRTNVAQVTQFYEKNTNDASAWMKATQDAIESTKTILTSMRAEFTSGATGTNTTESRKAILEGLKALKNQVYADGDADYAGRTLFTGYRTSSKLTVQETDLPLEYTGIKEVLTKDDMDTVTYISGKLDTNVDVEVAASKVEQSVESDDYYRIRLAYENLDDTTPTINLKDKDGNAISSMTVTKVVDTTAADYPDNAHTVGDNDVFFDKSTGELILGKNKADEIKNLTKDDTIEITYDKSKWAVADLRPEHYFDCTQIVKDEAGTVIDTIQYSSHDDEIKYDISTNQEMQINTYASQVFFHGIGRDVDEVIAAITDVNNAADKVTDLEAKLSKETDAGKKATIQKALDAANKEYTLVNDKLQKLFEHCQSTFDKYLKKTTLAGTECGTRLQRLDLVQNRLLDLKTTAQELADENENVEVTDIAINVSEAELTYNAALMATGKISQQNLLNYI